MEGEETNKNGKTFKLYWYHFFLNIFFNCSFIANLSISCVYVTMDVGVLIDKSIILGSETENGVKPGTMCKNSGCTTVSLITVSPLLTDSSIMQSISSDL